MDEGGRRGEPPSPEIDPRLPSTSSREPTVKKPLADVDVTEYQARAKFFKKCSKLLIFLLVVLAL
jgi:hypothetical protein